MRLKCMISLLAVLSSLILNDVAARDDVALKTNLLYDATLSPDLGVEVGLAPRWTIDISGNLNGWTVNDRSWRHWLVQPELRYWLCERFNGHFFAAHLFGGEYNFRNIRFPFKTFADTKEGRHYEGWFIGAGIAYGYQWVISRHWSVEGEVGLGYAYSPYRLYGNCARCLKKGHRNYVGPTKLAVSVIYAF